MTVVLSNRLIPNFTHSRSVIQGTHSIGLEPYQNFTLQPLVFKCRMFPRWIQLLRAINRESEKFYIFRTWPCQALRFGLTKIYRPFTRKMRLFAKRVGFDIQINSTGQDLLRTRRYFKKSYKINQNAHTKLKPGNEEISVQRISKNGVKNLETPKFWNMYFCVFRDLKIIYWPDLLRTFSKIPKSP